MDTEYDSLNWHKEFAAKIEQMIHEHRSLGMNFFRDELENWIINCKSPPFPIRDNEYGEPVEGEIRIHQAAVVLAVIHDKYCPRSKPIGQFTNKIEFDTTGAMTEQTRRNIAYYSLIAMAPESVSADEKLTLDYCYRLIADHLIASKETATKIKSWTVEMANEAILPIIRKYGKDNTLKLTARFLSEKTGCPKSTLVKTENWQALLNIKEQVRDLQGKPNLWPITLSNTMLDMMEMTDSGRARLIQSPHKKNIEDDDQY